MKIYKSAIHYKWIILIICLFVYSTSQLVRWNYASITKYLMDDLSIGKPELGLLGSAFFYAYAFAQIPWGTATDVYGPKKVIPFGIGILAFFLVGFALSSTLTQAITWRALMGVVAAAGYVPITVVLSQWFTKKERGFAMQIFSGVGGGLGEALTFLLIPLFALILGTTGLFGLPTWRGSTILMACIILLIAIGTALFMRSPADKGVSSAAIIEDTEEQSSLSYKDIVKVIIKDPALWCLSLVWSSYMCATRLVPGWLPLFATEYYIKESNLSNAEAMVAGGAMATMYVLGRVFGTPIVGVVSDRLLRRNIPRSVITGVGLLLISCVFYALTLRMPNTFTFAALSFFAGIVINIFPLINATATELWSVKSAGFANGIINMIGQFAGAVALSISGFMAVKFATDPTDYHSSFYGIWYVGIVTSVLGAIMTIYIIKREKQIGIKNKTQAETY